MLYFTDFSHLHAVMWIFSCQLVESELPYPNHSLSFGCGCRIEQFMQIFMLQRFSLVDVRSEKQGHYQRPWRLNRSTVTVNLWRSAATLTGQVRFKHTHTRTRSFLQVKYNSVNVYYIVCLRLVRTPVNPELTAHPLPRQCHGNTSVSILILWRTHTVVPLK